MYRPATLVPVVACLVSISSLSGCMQSKEEVYWQAQAQAANITIPSPAPQSNIIRVNKFFNEYPWLNFTGGGDGRVEGLKCTIYLTSPDSLKGVFGSGTIIVSMFRLDRDPSGNEIPTPVQEWELPPEVAYLWQTKKPSLLGWGYTLRLQWDKGIEVEGHKIAVVIKYVREDGRVISAAPQILRVPKKGDVRGVLS